MNAPVQAPRATIEDLLRLKERKAELIHGSLVYLMSPGHRPLLVAFEIAKSLDAWTRAEPGRGQCYPEGMIFRVPLMASGREAFVPDGAYATGPLPTKKFGVYQGAPAFAVEVRSADGYGPAAEAIAAAKRVDYFAAGTLVVWDADADAGVIHRYHAADPLTPRTFGPGELADAEPAVPGWRMSVDDIMGV